VDGIQTAHAQVTPVDGEEFAGGETEAVRSRFRPLREDADRGPVGPVPRTPSPDVDAVGVDLVEVEDHLDVAELFQPCGGVDRESFVEHDVGLHRGPVVVDRFPPPPDHHTDRTEFDALSDHRQILADPRASTRGLAPYVASPRCRPPFARRGQPGSSRLYCAPVARYVIDAPTLLHLVGDDVAIDPGHQLVAPNLIRSQALSLLLEAVRHGELDEDEALRRHERLTELKMRLLGDRVSRRRAWNIARAHGWDTTLDAEYVAVCQLQADALVTVDPAMQARAAGIVPLAPVAVLRSP
jgi:predicted nucleic acid-binding protein